MRKESLPQLIVKCSNCYLELRRWDYQVKKQKIFYCSKKCEAQHKQGMIPEQFKKHMGSVAGWNKGMRTPQETKNKQREAKLKYYNEHPEARERISISQVGKIQSKETIEKRIRKNTGQKRTLKVRLFLSSQKKGEGNHFWRGGISPIRRRLRESFRYKEWRSAVYERDDHTCQICRQRGSRLEADHIKPFSSLIEMVRKRNPDKLYEACINEPLLWDLKNGRTLCGKCHRKTLTYARNTAYQL